MVLNHPFLYFSFPLLLLNYYYWAFIVSCCASIMVVCIMFVELCKWGNFKNLFLSWDFSVFSITHMSNRLIQGLLGTPSQNQNPVFTKPGKETRKIKRKGKTYVLTWYVLVLYWFLTCVWSNAWGISCKDNFYICDCLVYYLYPFQFFISVAALKSLKKNWKNVPPNWKNSDPCGDSWEGIICDNSRVINLCVELINLVLFNQSNFWYYLIHANDQFFVYL